MTTNFGDFCPFSAKTIGFFSQNLMLLSKFWIIQLCFEPKTPIFSPNFSAKIFKNHNIGPGIGLHFGRFFHKLIWSLRLAQKRKSCLGLS
jgi:hypothetical protein